MLITDPRRPAQLLSQLSSYPNPALWGFPIDSEFTYIRAKFDESDKNLPSDASRRESRSSRYGRFSMNYLWDLGSQCNKILGYPKASAGIREVLSEGKSKFILAIVKCTHPDDRLLPPADQIEEIRKIAVPLGFKGEPGWYIKADT